MAPATMTIMFTSMFANMLTHPRTNGSYTPGFVNMCANSNLHAIPFYNYISIYMFRLGTLRVRAPLRAPGGPEGVRWGP